MGVAALAVYFLGLAGLWFALPRVVRYSNRLADEGEFGFFRIPRFVVWLFRGVLVAGLLLGIFGVAKNV